MRQLGLEVYVNGDTRVVYDPAVTSHSEVHRIVDTRKLEEFKDIASDVEKRIGNGFKVTAHAAWKGTGMTLYIPEKFLPKD